jgi:regulator of CtrA degradation
MITTGDIQSWNTESKFLAQAFKDGVELLEQAKNYMTYQERKERESASLSTGLRIGYQQTRITARLMHALAWLLGHKAVAAGEISAEELDAAEWQLGGGFECIETNGHTDERLPKGLRELLEKSHSYYMRIARLEQMLKSQAVEAPAAKTKAAPAFIGLHIVGGADYAQAASA